MKYHSGIVWSTDAILLESSALVKEWSKRGTIGVDMESSTLFTIARLFGIKATSILVVSDSPINGKIAIAEKLSKGISNAIDLSFSALLD